MYKPLIISLPLGALRVEQLCMIHGFRMVSHKVHLYSCHESALTAPH